jgi:mannosyltransferase OCH1-like enzyme
MIPKIIHQIWIGDPGKRPKEFMETWKIEGWEYRLWTEREIDGLRLENRSQYDFLIALKSYAAASDVARVEILKKFGGIYIDADTERTAEIDKAPFMKAKFFAVQANKNKEGKEGQTRIANGVMGAVPDFSLIKRYISEIGVAKTLIPAWKTIGGTLLTQCIYDHISAFGDKGIMLLEPHTFYPFDSKGEPSRTKGKSYARHIWGSTHRLYGRI